MRKGILIGIGLSLLLTVQAGADTWLPQEDVGKPGDGTFREAIHENICKNANATEKTCIRAVGNYDPNTYKVIPEEKQDWRNATYSIMELEDCDDRNDCIEKMDAKICSDPEYTVRASVIDLEVRCEKFISVPMVLTGKNVAVRDPLIAANYKAQLEAKKLARDVRKNQAKAGKNKLKSLKWSELTDAEKTKIMRYVLRNLE